MEIAEENIDNQLVEEEKDEKICNRTKSYSKINILVDYYLELKDTLGSLDKYIICQKHYNQ
ncbi:14653_t:CDS:2, partial [Racocetra fulgida]